MDAAHNAMPTTMEIQCKFRGERSYPISNFNCTMRPSLVKNIAYEYMYPCNPYFNSKNKCFTLRAYLLLLEYI